MRCTFFALVFLVACGDNLSLRPDANTHSGDGPNIDAFVFLDGPTDAAGIATAIGTPDGDGLMLPINNVTVTYLKPQLGSLTNDPAGFTIQAVQAGPGLFVTVDPTMTVPPLSVGDVVSFDITTMATDAMERRAGAITNLTRSATGTDVSALSRDITAATDVVTNVTGYDNTIITVTGVFAGNFASSGTGFQAAAINTTGITGNASLTFRSPATLVDALDMVGTCSVTATNIPVDRFNTTVELGAYVASDFVMTGCPAPTIVSAASAGTTSANITLSRHIDPATFMADGSQFTIAGLAVSGATMTGRVITLTTDVQVPATPYTVDVAAGLTDLAGTPLGATTTNFTGFVQQAGVVVNELNANVTGGCDLIELRVISDGSMGNFKVFERTGVVASGELDFTFPAGFNVTKNSLVMLHLNSASTTCNPNGATQELLTPIDQPVAMFAKNYDTAYDFWATDTGLTGTDNVITVYDSTGAIVDAVFLTSGSGAADTLAQADIVAAANQWTPAPAVSGMYTATEFATIAAVPGLNGTGTSVTGTATSIQRVNDTDTNAKGDWATLAQTFGTINAGQTVLMLRHRTR